MRKILLKRFIPTVWVHAISGCEVKQPRQPALTLDWTKKPSTGMYEENYSEGEYYFHMWSIQTEQVGHELAKFTMALVEMPDGTMTEVMPDKIKFISAPDENTTPEKIEIKEFKLQ